MVKLSVEALLLTQISCRPAMAIQDVVKLLFQRTFGGGHLVTDTEDSLRRLRQECEDYPVLNDGRFEFLGNGLCRLNLGGIKAEGFSLETVNRLFVWSAVKIKGELSVFEHSLAQLRALCAAGRLPYSLEELDTYLSAYRSAGYPPVGHTEEYRTAYRPAYRVVLESVGIYAPLIKRLDSLLQQRKRILLAIDGNSGAGKTHLADMLAAVYSAAVIHMDDFFLPMDRKTPDRLAEPGGNVDYERVRDEVLLPYRQGVAVAYHPFDCHRQALREPVKLPESRLTVLEGVYSLHPQLAEFYDYAVFLRLGSGEQVRRIRERSGERLLRRFMEEWIPLENRYFDLLNIPSVCQMILDTE